MKTWFMLIGLLAVGFTKTKTLEAIPELHRSRTSIVEQLGQPTSGYLPEYDRNTGALSPTRRAWLTDVLGANRIMWLSTPVAETYVRAYRDIDFELDIYYEADNYRAGLIGPMRAVGMAWTSKFQVLYPDVLPSVPWFEGMCTSGCDMMNYTADGIDYSLVCPPHPKASTLAAAFALPRIPCLRADLMKGHPGFLMIHYAEFNPAAEELMAEGPVHRYTADMEGVREVAHP